MWVGNVKRVVQYKRPSAGSPSAKEWMYRKNPAFVSMYGMASPSLRSGYYSVSHYSKYQPEFNLSIWKESGDWTEKHFRPHMCGSLVSDWKFVISQIDHSTSPGFPWNMRFGTKGSFFENENHQQILEEYWNALASSNPIKSLWQWSQKYEMRLLEKLQQDPPGIRGFMCAAVEHVTSTNRLCLDMNNRFYRSNNKTWSFVGGSKFNGGFNNLMFRLGRFCFGFDLDGSKYDTCMFRAMMFDLARIRYSFLQQEDQTEDNWCRMIELYVQAVYSMIALEGGDVCFKTTGMPSGFGNTIVDNTIALFRYLAMIWLTLLRNEFASVLKEFEKKKELLSQLPRASDEYKEVERSIVSFRECGLFSYSYFLSNVEAGLNGDDNTFTVSDNCLSWFNYKTIVPVFAALGLKITSNSEEPVMYYDLSFLSQTVVRHNSMWLPKPDQNKILSSLMLNCASSDIRWSLLRAFALRIESWACQDTRKLIMDYIDSLRKQYQRQLCGECPIPGTMTTISMVNIEKGFLTDRELESLYCGYERNGETHERVNRVVEMFESLGLFM